MVDYLYTLSNSVPDMFVVVLFTLFFLSCIFSNIGDLVVKTQKWKNRILVVRATAGAMLILIFFQAVLMVAALRMNELMDILGNYYFLVVLAVANYTIAKSLRK